MSSAPTNSPRNRAAAIIVLVFGQQIEDVVALTWEHVKVTEDLVSVHFRVITVRVAAQIIGREQSWITRQLNAGALRGRKIGNEWWTTRDWALEYRHIRSTPRPAKRN